MDSELNSFKSQVDVDSVVPPNIMLKVGVGSNVSSVSMWYRAFSRHQAKHRADISDVDAAGSLKLPASAAGDGSACIWDVLGLFS